MKYYTLPTDEGITRAFNGTRFGPDETIEFRRDYITKALLKNLVGYHNGYTMHQILVTLELVRGDVTEKPKLLKLGKWWLYEQSKPYPTMNESNCARCRNPLNPHQQVYCSENCKLIGC